MRRSIDVSVPTNPLISAIEEIKKNHKLETMSAEALAASQKTKITDIMTFCDGPDYLDLLNEENNLDLYLPQRIILKCFYKGTIGNEDLELTQEEWEWLYNNQEDEELDGVVYKKNIKDVVRKMHRRVSDDEMPYFKELQLVLGRRGTKCRSEDDLISTTEGSLTFRQLCDRLNDGENIGICTYDTKTWKRSTTYDVKAKDNGSVDCYQLVTSRGIEETSSWNHPYLVWREDFCEPQFIQLKDVRAGDKIAVADKTELFGKGSIGINKAALLGHFQGDGGITHDVGYSTACDTMLKDFINLIQTEFPNYQVKHKDKYDYCVIKESGRAKQNGSQKNEVKEWLKAEGVYGTKAIDKRVPKSILQGSKEEVVMFLSRFFGCDGFASIDSYKDDYHKTPKTFIGCTLGSKQFISDIRHLLLKFGIHATVRHSPVKYKDGYNDSWQLKVIRRNCLNIFQKEINIFSKEDIVKKVVSIAYLRNKAKSSFDNLPKGIWNRFRTISKNNNISVLAVTTTGRGRLRNEYSANREHVFSIGKKYNDDFLIDAANSDIKWDTVKSVEHVGKKHTVDLQVDPHHIIGGDIISHNTLMASVITAYEAYKLLVINNGNPHGYYKLPADDEIAIINVALSQGQAGRLFGQIQARLRNSPFFKGRIAKETASEIRLFTDKDLEKKRKGSSISVNGSIILLCGHSNPDSLAGYSTVLLLFDEIAFYDETGQITGKYFYTRLKPSLSKFFKYNAGRIVQISSPKSKLGIFYDTWLEAKEDDSILSFQLPTWDVNPDVPYDEPELARDRKSNPEMFAVEYGAQFAEGGTYHRYFPEGLIQRCIRTDLAPHSKLMPRCNYYIHVDPAKKGNNYAAVMVAKQRYTNQMGQKRVRCILAGLWVWRPLPGLGVQFGQVDKDMIQICSIFHPMCVTYDDYHSMHSLQLLRSHGIHTKQLSYNRSIKAKLYQNLRDIMAYQPEPELYLYDNGGESSLLLSELANLNLKQTQRGYTIIPDKNADVKTDDLADCLAGACASANEGIRMGLPEPVVVKTGWM